MRRTVGMRMRRRMHVGALWVVTWWLLANAIFLVVGLSGIVAIVDMLTLIFITINCYNQLRILGFCFGHKHAILTIGKFFDLFFCTFKMKKLNIDYNINYFSYDNQKLYYTFHRFP